MRFDSMEPMALLPAAVESFIATLRGKIAKQEPPQPFAIDEGGNQVALDANGGSAGMLAVVPVWGVLTPDGWGGTSLDGLARQMRQLDANPNIAKILLNVTSPGGTVTGTQEAADAVRAVRDAGNTQIVALANGMMASAATWIGAAASEVVITPSGQAGSIGVLCMYTDWSKALEEMGVKVDVIRTPDKKARFSSVEPMTAEMRQFLEDRVASSYEKFKRAMADNRGVRIDQVEKKFGGGEMLSAEEAVDAGLVDRIGTLDQTIGRMMAKTARRAPSSAKAGIARAELESF